MLIHLICATRRKCSTAYMPTNAWLCCAISTRALLYSIMWDGAAAVLGIDGRNLNLSLKARTRFINSSRRDTKALLALFASLDAATLACETFWVFADGLSRLTVSAPCLCGHESA